jgi:hypothetical protein
VSRFITQPRFEVGEIVGGKAVPPEVLRLNTMVTVAHAELKPLEIEYDIFQVVNEYA